MAVAKRWLCWNPGGKYPTREHETLGAAVAEAKRLVEERQCREVHVLETVTVVVPQLRPVAVLEMPVDPFAE
jgi:hypothetical protein